MPGRSVAWCCIPRSWRSASAASAASPTEELCGLVETTLAEHGLAAARDRLRGLARAEGGRARDPRAGRAARRAGPVLPGRERSRPRPPGSPIPRSWCSGRPAATASPRARRSRRSAPRASCWWRRPGRRARRSRSGAPRRRSIRRGSGARRAGSRSSGLGPGAAAWRTPEAEALLADAEDWVGYPRLPRPARAAPGRRAGPPRLRARRGAGAGATGRSSWPPRGGGSR